MCDYVVSTICVLRVSKIHRPNRMSNVYVYDCTKEWNSKCDKKKLNENEKKKEEKSSLANTVTAGKHRVLSTEQTYGTVDVKS